MAKLELSQPTLFLLYGFPGAGKTYLSRQLSEEVRAAHIQSDRIRSEVFETPKFDRSEDKVVSNLTIYMIEEFLNAGISVVCDMNAMRVALRRSLRELARRSKAQVQFIWLQLDTETAFSRVVNRDKRRVDDKYAMILDRTSFEALVGQMQNPTPTEEYVVVSGKHTYQTQRSAVIKKLYASGLLQSDQTTAGLAKPELVNLVPNPNGGRVDPSRRNILIR